MTKVIALLLLSVTLLAGCGFRLAGDRPLPAALQKVFIDSAQPFQVSEPPVERTLRARLQSRGATVLNAVDADTVVIKLTGVGENRQVLSIGTDSKVLEYQITSSATYSVFRGKETLVPTDTVSLNRSYTYNPQAALAEEIKESHLREYLQSELAELMLLRLETTLNRVVPTLNP